MDHSGDVQVRHLLIIKSLCRIYQTAKTLVCVGVCNKSCSSNSLLFVKVNRSAKVNTDSVLIPVFS